MKINELIRKVFSIIPGTGSVSYHDGGFYYVHTK